MILNFIQFSTFHLNVDCIVFDCINFRLASEFCKS